MCCRPAWWRGGRRSTCIAESQPDDGFVSVEPDLEDVYFLQIRNAGRAAETPAASAASNAPVAA
jgi:hypothetical protein